MLWWEAASLMAASVFVPGLWHGEAGGASVCSCVLV